MRRIMSVCLAFALVFSLACSDDSTGTTDSKVNTKKDGGTTPDTGAPEKIDCTQNTCYDYVTNTLILPTDSTESEKFSLIIGTKKYNSLGGILAPVR